MHQHVKSGSYKAAVLLVVLSFLTPVLYYGCKKDKVEIQIDDDSTNTLSALLPASSRQKGIDFAAALMERAKSRPNFIKPLHSQISIDRADVDKHMPPTPLVPFSFAQRKILIAIIQSMRESKSVDEFLRKELDIAKAIPKTLSTAEREVVYDVLAALHYTIGQVASKPRVDNVPIATTYVPPISNYPEILAEMWEIAILEPSPFGEIVAFLITVGFAVAYVYSQQMCIEKYIECALNTPYLRCGDCFRYCEGQHIWKCPF